MNTFTRILQIFQDYLQSESCIEVLPTKWGYVRLYYEEPYGDSLDALLCKTPEELFEILLDHVLADREYWLSREATKSSREISERLKAVRDFYVAEFQKTTCK